MQIQQIKRVYFIGIGGIGMSAIARFFAQRQAVVAGYDLTKTDLTSRLVSEGMSIIDQDDIKLLDKDADLVVYTPAIPASNAILNWYRKNGYPVYKRSDVLQWITESYFSITVAGTHGKTTISTLIAYLIREAGEGCNAFLGGISVNYESNYWSSEQQVAVIEADEYDRSFLKLFPNIAILTAMDADHLDIYGTEEEVQKAFIQYTGNIKEGGALIVKHGLSRMADLMGANKITYSLQDDAADVLARHIVQRDGSYHFDVVAKDWVIKDLYLPIGGMHNVENTVAAIAVTRALGIDPEKVKTALARFKGVKRRFEYIIKTNNQVFIDDYAHHPEELEALIVSAKKLFPGKKCMVVFQPHLYSRTRDFAQGFADSLSLADEVVLLDIYPARELPIEGVTSRIIAEKMTNTPVRILSKIDLLAYMHEVSVELFITAGAGDIDKMVLPLKTIIESK